MIKAQLVCTNFEPVNNPYETLDVSDQIKHFGTTNGDFECQFLNSCTLMYAKQFDFAVISQNIGTATTSEGLLVPTQMPRALTAFSSSKLLEDEIYFSDKIFLNLYQFEKNTPLRVPILKHTHQGVTTYCIDYRERKQIENLSLFAYEHNEDDGYSFVQKKVYTSHLYDAAIVTGKDDNSYSYSITGIPLPLKEGHVAPLMSLKKPLKINTKVRSKPTHTESSLAKAFTQPIVHNIIGVAMQRINKRREGDIMLYNDAL